MIYEDSDVEDFDDPDVKCYKSKFMHYLKILWTTIVYSLAGIVLMAVFIVHIIDGQLGVAAHYLSSKVQNLIVRLALLITLIVLACWMFMHFILFPIFGL